MQTRVFSLNHTKVNWTEAKEFCENRFPGGRLALDTSNHTNNILRELMEANNTDKAWIGAYTKSMYWNWSPSKHGK